MMLDCGCHTGGVLGIVIFNKIIGNKILEKCKDNKILKTISEMLVITISAQIIIIPIMAINFNKISIMFWLSNIIASPIVAICIIGGFAIVFLSLIPLPFANVLGVGINLLLNILIAITKQIASISFANIYVKTPNIVFIVLYYLLLLKYIVKNKPKHKILKNFIKSVKDKRKYIITVILIISIITYGIKIANPNTYIFFIDVGQGDSTLIVTNTGKKVLIDGGGSDSNYDVGRNVLIPYLLDRRIKTIDYAMISHFDSDHCLRCAFSYGKFESNKCYNIKTSKRIGKL